MKKNTSYWLRWAIFSIFILVIFGCSPQKNVSQNKIVVWHWMTDRNNAFKALAEKYEVQTGIEVEFKLFFPPDIYSQKVIAAARAENLPDIFGILGEKKTFASFIKAGHIFELTPVMEADSKAWRSRFYPYTFGQALFRQPNRYGVKPGIYAVPIDTTVMQFVYNVSLLEQAGLSSDQYPRTFDELISQAKLIKKKTGVDGFICGWGEGWLLNCLATEWAINNMGEEAFIETIQGKIPYTDQRWVEVFSLFSTLKDSGILVSNIATMTNKEAEDAFARGKAAFSFNGSWSVNVYKQLNPDLRYAFFSLPQVNSAYPVKVWGGAGSSFMVNAKSTQRDMAVAFLDWLTQQPQQQFLVAETNNLSAIQGCEEGLPSVLAAPFEATASLTHPDVWPQNEDARVIEVMNRGLQQIVMGLKTAKEVASEIQQTKERLAR